jgi:mannosyltransferase OCH1-like enzyme
MFFTYWTNATGNISPERQLHFDNMVADWRSRFPAFRVFSDDDIEPLLAGYHRDLPGIFRRIKIPACKSDLARLLLLHTYGGFYVDAHTGTGDGNALARVLEVLADRDLILFDKREAVKDAADKHIVNGAMAARRGAQPLRLAIFEIIANLIRHERQEAENGEYVPYNIFVITGSWSLTSTLFDRIDGAVIPKKALAGSLHVEAIDPEIRPWPFVFYKFYGYRETGKHWSERQNSERLFAPRA